jgi:hypothetical protein
MKAELHFSGQPITIDERYREEVKEEIIRLNESINEKVKDKIISIPCLPTKEMAIDLLAFSSIFGFTEEEISYIDCAPFYPVADIIIYPKHIRVSLDYAE